MIRYDLSLGDLISNFFVLCSNVKVYLQGRRHVFESGQADEAIECQRHETWESLREGIIPPLIRGVWGTLTRKFVNF